MLVHRAFFLYADPYSQFTADMTFIVLVICTVPSAGIASMIGGNSGWSRADHNISRV